MKLRIIPLEERIVLDAAAAVTILAASADNTQDASATAEADAGQADNHVVDAIPPPPSQIQAPHVLVVSSDIQDPQGLINAAKSSVQILYYDATTTTLEQLQQRISDLLNGQKAESIAFAAEGNQGIIQLVTSNWVQLSSVTHSAEMQAFWQGIGDMLTDTGRIDLLSCNFAGSIEGQAQVSAIDILIGDGKNVAASTDFTGNINGGDWLLEVGNVDAGLIYFDSDQLSEWAHVMPTAIEYGLIAAQIAIVAGGTVYVLEDTTFTSPGNVILSGNGLVGSILIPPTHAASFSFDSTTFGYTYTPTTDYLGADAFAYSVTDPTSGNSSIFFSTINVVNTLAPAANGDTFLTSANTPLTGSLIANDVNTSGSTVQLVAAPTNGTVAINALDGTFTYTPNAGYTGTDFFTYNVSSGLGISNTAIGAIFVTAPIAIAVNDSYADFQGATLNGNVLANDTNPGNVNLTAQLVSGPLVGSLTLNSNGTFVYTSNGTLGTDTFTYRSQDPIGNLSNIATVTIVVVPPLLIGDDAYTATQNGTLNGASVLANDSNYFPGLESAPFLKTGPANGTLTLNPDGTFVYNPATNFYGIDTFEYSITTPIGDLDGIATITVNPLPPVANNDAYTTTQNAAINGENILVNDGNINNLALSAQLVMGPANGTLTLNTNGTFIYNPFTNYYGSDSFSYIVQDSLGNFSNNGLVAITVDALPPVANNDSVTVDQNNSVTTNIVDNDGNINNLALTAVVGAGPLYGTLSGLSNDGFVTYTPDVGFVGTDTFTYYLVDSLSNVSNIATVTITIVQAAPVAAMDSYTELANLPTQNYTSVLVNDTSTLPLTAQLISGPSNGTLVLNSDGSFSYRSALGFSGIDTFSYVALDNLGNQSNVATVSINIQDVVTQDPVLQLKGNINSTYIENKSPTILAHNVRIQNVNTSTYDQGQLIVEIGLNGTSDDRLTIQNSSNVTTSAQNILYNGVVVGTYAGGIGLSPLEIIFNAHATGSIVTDIAEQIAFSNVSEAPSSDARSVEFVLTDGQSGISAPAFKTVHVFSMNDAPQITSDGGLLVIGAQQIANIGALSNLHITDVDGTENGIYLVNLRVLHGYLDFTDDLTDLESIDFLQDPGNGRIGLIFKGNLADINAALARLTYISRGTYTGSDVLSVSTIDFGSSLLGGIAADVDWLELQIVA